MQVRISPASRRADGGRLLVGGSPLRVLRLRRPAPTTAVDATTALGLRLLDSGIGEPVLDPMPPVDPRELTVVIPARDSPQRVARCRDALEPLRVLVVDDACPAPLPGAAVRLPRSGGPAAARNAGLALVDTPYVAFVDADVHTSAADLLALSRHFADPAVVLAGPRVRGLAAGSRWWQRYDAAFSALDLGAAAAVVRPHAAVSYLPSACLVARTDALRPGFDPSLHVGEDVDLTWRLVAAGGRVRYDPSVVARHETRGSAAMWLRRIGDYGTSAAPLAARHGAAVAPAVLGPVPAVAAAALLGRSWLAVPLAGAAVAGTAARLHRRHRLPWSLALRLAGRGFGWAVQQECRLALRHWWPAVALAAATTRPGRRVLATATLIDTAVALRDRRGLDAGTVLAGRRMSDLAYGLGLWRGALADRSPRSLLPRVPGRHGRRSAAAPGRA